MKTLRCLSVRFSLSLVASTLIGLAGCGGGGIEAGISQEAAKGSQPPSGFADQQKKIGNDMLKRAKK